MDDSIDMDDRPCGRLVGSVGILIRYGRPGKEIYELHTECNVSIIMEHYGFVGMISGLFNALY
jgi:hypothetical protein